MSTREVQEAIQELKQSGWSDKDIASLQAIRPDYERICAQRDKLLAAAKDALDAMLIPGVQISTTHWNYLRDELRQAWRENSFLRIAVTLVGLACLILIGWAIVSGAFVLEGYPLP